MKKTAEKVDNVEYSSEHGLEMTMQKPVRLKGIAETYIDWECVLFFSVWAVINIMYLYSLTSGNIEVIAKMAVFVIVSGMGILWYYKV